MFQKISIPLIAFFLFLSSTGIAQEPFPFWNEVQRFKTMDSAVFPVANQVLFVGSSSFTFWKDAQDYFPKSSILNRAFGGSTLQDQIRYRYDLLFPYSPKQIVLYCGENDFAYTDKPSVETVMQRFNILYKYIRSKYPQLPFVYVSMKPSPSRRHLLEKYKAANEQIKNLLKQDKYAKFVDVYALMLNKDGNVKGEIFKSDSLHMNEKGYAIWQKALQPYLLKTKK